MAEGIVADKILESFGGEFFTGDQSAGAQWSPNMYSKLYILDDAIVTQTHFGKFEAIPVPDPDTLDYEEAKGVFEIRRLGCLEGIYVSPGAGGIGVAQMITEFFRVGEDRLHVLGEVSGMGPEGPAVTGEQEIPGTEGWEARYDLQPEHYDMDKEGGKLWSILQKQAESAGSVEDEPDADDSEVEKIGPDEGEDSKGTYEDVKSYYADSANGTINKILREYRKIFSSGFEVITPAGLLMENDNGYGVLGHLKGNALTKDKVNRNLQHLYDYFRKTMNLTEVPVRSIRDIANVIVTGKAGDGKRYDGTLVFPYKMMEYAFGRRRMANSDSKSMTNYQEHSKRADWESYAQDEVAESLRDVILHVLWVSLKQVGMDTEPESPKANQVADSILMKFQKAFCTCILVSKYDTSDGNLVAVKVRILDPNGSLPRDRNVLEELISKSHGAIDDSDKKLVYPPESNGSYVEYNLELDSKLANAEPLFAYKALEKIIEQGQSIDYSNIILGKDANDKILRNGSGVNLRRKLSHCVVAGSRAGKGVWTFSILAGSCLSKRALFYLDNKPDMASLFRSLAPNGFVVNGSNITTDPENGTDYFEQFADVDSWINDDNIPDYVVSLLKGKSYRNLGSFVYVKALTLVMGILAARVEVPSKVNELGGPEGIVVVVDELANANANLLAQLGVFNQHIANTGYYKELKAQMEGEGTGKINADKPQPEDYWFTHFYLGLKESLSKLQALSNAGLKNVEADRSDVFSLTQEPPEMITSAGQVAELFKSPNKNSNAIASALDDSRILPSFALLGGTDVFIGYDKDNRSFLDQGNPRSKSYPYLNEVNRNFGYIPQYGPDIRDKFNTSALAEKAIYYKPMLLFADGKTESYFVQNALGYAKQAGITDPDDIIRRNEDPNNPGKINPAVGFEGYLNMAGLDRSEISSTLSKSGEIAQNVVNAMGYDGSWMDLLLDFRPEWQFTVEDVISSMKGKTLQDSLPTRMEDFMAVYPEAFGGNTGVEEDVMGDYNDPGYPDDDVMGGYDEEELDEEFEDIPQFVPQEPSDEDEDGYDNHAKKVADAAKLRAGTLPGVVEYNDDLGREGLHTPSYVSNDGDTSEFDINPQEAYSTVPSYVPEIAPTEDLSEADTEELEDRKEPSLNIDWNDPQSVHMAQAYLKQRLHGGSIDTHMANSSYGNGFYSSPDGQSDNYRPHGGEQIVAPSQSLSMEEPKTIANLVDYITDGAYKVVGGPSEVRSIRVIDGSLILNNVMYRPRLSDEYLRDAPMDLASEVRSGNVARLFNWSTLKDISKIRRLSFDSLEFVSDYVSGQLGWKGRVSVHLFFERFQGLRSLTLGDGVFTRENYKSAMRDNPKYYQPAVARGFADAADNVFSKGTSSSWNLARTSLTRKDIGAASKFFAVTAGLTGAAMAGTAAVTTKTGKGLFSGVRYGLRSMQDAMKEARDFK